MLRHENLCTLLGKESWSAWEESARAVKFQRRRRSQGYIRRRVMMERFQKVRLRRRIEPMVSVEFDSTDFSCERRRSWAQNSPMEVQPRNRCVISNVSWWLVRILGNARSTTVIKRRQTIHVMIMTGKVCDPFVMQVQLMTPVKISHHSVPTTAAPLWIPP